MKIYLILSVARQVDGEYCMVKAEKAFRDSTKANSFVESLSKRYAESIQTPSGLIECVCERGVFEVDVED